MAESFGAAVTLAGGEPKKNLSLKSFKAAAITGGIWAVTGDTGSVQFLTSAAAWNATFTGAVKAIKVKTDLRCGLVKAGSFGTIAVASLGTDNGGTPFGFEAGTIKKVSVKTHAGKRSGKALDDPLDSFAVNDLEITLV